MLCNLQSEIESRELKIRESSSQEEPLSNEMVQSIINKWEEIQTTATTLRPALQVINLFTNIIYNVCMGPTCTCIYGIYMYMYIWDLYVHVCK